MEVVGRYIVLLMLLAGASCKKAEERACLKSTGGEDELEIQLISDFDTLFLADNFDYTLRQDTVNSIRIVGGEHVIPWVSVEQKPSSVSIFNSNTCNFLRSFKRRIRVEITYTQLRYIRYSGGGSLVTVNPLTAPVMHLYMIDGGGSVHLDVNTGYLEATIGRGYGDYTIAGNSVLAFLACQSNGFCDTRELTVTQSLNVLSNSAADMLINAQGTNLQAEIRNRGDIRYVGVPNTMHTIIHGEGQVVPEN
jgi:hypothetical protein